MEYRYLDEPLCNYIENLSAKTPCPGGGSASILSLSLANALILMVCNFTVESKIVDETSHKISKEILDKANEVQQYINKGIEQDSIIYREIQKTAKLAKKDFNNKKSYYDALKNSVDFHLKMLNYCNEILEWSKTLVEKGNPYLISDIGVATSLISGVIKATRINIFVNLREIQDKKYISEIINRVENKSGILIDTSQKIILSVEKKLSNLENMEGK
ncbi:MAG: Methenyltetrahydrofolate cyclohydrolase [candidate division TA06 bacterium ADurb.Bin131]|jgi:formiminotetrahydrofolate cyclodeaminase|uniref:Methenyltetrahydrofolate cyclohydrolase n=1 Tax=candidate division TA06 bacterium ADurb.Bin131 TaxID=1852827 RepID=A0A1V6CDH1_UNCT6|nr:MAG: Methenyltetrahydrofolate cyclohydrolase [candidate division TA06 bacterium ADurb.Bin131]